MRTSWWELGEGTGRWGGELALNQIECAFCGERGHWALAHRAQKRKANGRKTLNFDTYQCSSCAGFVMVLWSASEHAANPGLHDFRVLPWSLRELTVPESWPTDVGRYWQQAHRNLRDGSWDAASLMARSAMQAALRTETATGGSLQKEIDQLAATGVLPNVVKEWAHELRELGNDSAHPTPSQPSPDPADVRDVLKFLDFLFEYLFSLPADIAAYRARRDTK